MTRSREWMLRLLDTHFQGMTLEELRSALGEGATMLEAARAVDQFIRQKLVRVEEPRESAACYHLTTQGKLEVQWMKHPRHRGQGAG